MVLHEPQIRADNAALTAPLRAAIEAAYRIFAGHSLPRPLNICRCRVCCHAEAEQALVATPLRELTSLQLSEYTNSAHGYDETRDGAALRHFLPRYFELIARNDPPHYGDLWHCLARLGRADYRRRWPAGEVEAIDRYFDALLADKLADVVLAAWPAGQVLAYPVDDLLEMMAIGGADVERLLAVFESATDPAAALHMAALATRLSFRDGAADYASDMLDEYPEARRAIAAFLAHPDRPARLQQARQLLEGQPTLQAIVDRGRERLDSRGENV